MLNSLTSQYFVCRTCGVVDHNFKRMKIGEKCSECGVPSTGGQLHYSISFKTLVQLMEEMMELKPARAIDGPGPGIAVVLFFCTLTENLLDKFLLDLMKALKIPPRVQKRLLEDHRFVTQRVQKLFPSLAGEKWKDAISKISAANTSAYQAANDLYLQVIASAHSQKTCSISFS